MDFNVLRVRPSPYISTAGLTSDEQRNGHRRRRTTTCAHYVEANKVRFTMEAIMEVTVLQVSPLLHTSAARFTGPTTDD